MTSDRMGFTKPTAGTYRLPQPTRPHSVGSWRMRLVQLPPAKNCARFASAVEAMAWDIYVVARPDMDRHSETLLVSRIRSAGLTGPIRWVAGEYDLNDSPFGALDVDHAGHVVRELGMSLGHVRACLLIAERHSHAWVFEDDVVFHDNFKGLFPTYWASDKVCGSWLPVDVFHPHTSRPPSRLP